MSNNSSYRVEEDEDIDMSSSYDDDRDYVSSSEFDEEDYTDEGDYYNKKISKFESIIACGRKKKDDGKPNMTKKREVKAKSKGKNIIDNENGKSKRQKMPVEEEKKSKKQRAEEQREKDELNQMAEDQVYFYQ
jgi:hypothetical protein